MEKERVKAFAEKVFGDMAGAMTYRPRVRRSEDRPFQRHGREGALDAGSGRRDDQSAAALRRGVAEGNGVCRVPRV